VVKALRKAGAEQGEISPTTAPKPSPAASPRAAIDRAVPLLQRSDVAFLKKAGCVSCHNNNLTAMTIALLRDRALPFDADIARSQVKRIASYIEGNRELYWQGVSIPGGVDTTGYILLGLAAEGHPPDLATDAMARYLRGRQRADGGWSVLSGRPPIESSDIQVTAAALRAIQVYGPKAQRELYAKAVQTAAEWLAGAEAKTTEERAFQLLGLTWGSGKREAIRKAGARLLAGQNTDGGWAQIATLSSDAYATGQALVALKTAGVVSADDTAYKRGIQYLLNTQLADGSWYVRSRSLPFQPYFESDFPHGADQFISAAATNWAAMALAHTIR
jgi:hypothetical protein